MYKEIAERFLVELKERHSFRIIVSDSSEEDIEDVSKRKRGRPQKIKIKEETIDELLKTSLCRSNIPVQEVQIEGKKYNKCIYTNDLYDNLGNKVGTYSMDTHARKK